ncbi:hypothetical protein ACGF0D_10820 [Kitasatospora sp. NPDC048298]|uniref:hypothetical protein n=1 Tax=Kitasatospora sp. NPDC048298 TaxID=3364049 RepID=UPI0037247EF5
MIPTYGQASRFQLQLVLEILQDPWVGIENAAREAGLSREQVEYRATQDAAFREKLDALRPVGEAGQRQHPRSTTTQHQSLLRLAIEQGASIRQAAEQIGVTNSVAKHLVRSDRELTNLVESLRAAGKLRRGGYEPKAINEQWLKNVWLLRPSEDAYMTTKEIADAVGLSDAQVRNRAAKLGLPRNRKAALITERRSRCLSRAEDVVAAMNTRPDLKGDNE